MNKTILIIVIVLIAILGGYFFLRSGYQAPGSEGEISPSPSSEVKEVTIIGTEFSFLPAEIVVNLGQKVKIIFENKGNAPHNLVIKELGVKTKIIGSGQTDVVEFTASTPGKFDIICSVSGHKELGMKAELTVE